MKRLSRDAWTALTSLGSVGLAVLAAKLWGFTLHTQMADILPANYGGMIGALSAKGQTELLYCLGCLAVISFGASFALARGHMRKLPTFVAAALAAYGWAASAKTKGVGAADSFFLELSAVGFVALCWICCNIALWARDSKRYHLAHLAPLSAILLGIYAGVAAEAKCSFATLVDPERMTQPVVSKAEAPAPGTVVTLHSGMEPYVQPTTAWSYIDQNGLEMKKLLWNWDRTGAAKLVASRATLGPGTAWFCLYGAARLAPGPVTQELLAPVTDRSVCKLTSQAGARQLNLALARHRQPSLAIDSSLPDRKQRYSNGSVELSNPQASVAGTLLINGKPAAGVRLRLVDAYKPELLDQAYRNSRDNEARSFRAPNSAWGLTLAKSDCITDAQGRFRMDHLDSTNYLLQCRLEGSRSVNVTSAAPVIQLQQSQQFDAGTLQLDVH
jgi:hypothetical protein